MFFRLATWELALILLAIVLGTMAIGLVLGRYLRHRSEHLREPVSVLQAALLGLVGLVLAFGLALAVGRYEARRTAVVDEANAIGTTYLRAQTLPEPIRTQSLERLVRYTDTSIALANSTRRARRRTRPSPTVSVCSGSSGGLPARRSPKSRSTAHRGSTSRR
jgi:hypothetical protein